MSQEEIIDFFQEARKSEGTIFRCDFIKRTTGEYRIMVARLGVKKHLKGGDAPYDFNEKKLLPVFDMQKQAYRSIPFEGIKYLKVRGREFGCRPEQIIEVKESLNLNEAIHQYL